MGRTIKELGESLSVEEMLEWKYYFNSEPNEYEKIRYQVAQQSVFYANVNYKDSFTLEDIFIDFSKKDKDNEAEPTSNKSENENFREKNRAVKEQLLKQLKQMKGII